MHAKIVHMREIHKACGDAHSVNDPCGRAPDEVERLRCALRKVMDHGDRAAVEIARDALGNDAEW